MELASDDASDPDPMAFSTALKRFKRSRKDRLSENTITTEERHFARWLDHWPNKKEIRRMTMRSVERLFEKLQDCEWAGSSLNRSRTLLKAFFKFTRARGWGPKEDVMATTPRFQERVQRPTIALNPEQVDRLLRACREKVKQRVEGKRIGGTETSWDQTWTPPEWLYPLVFTALRTLLRMKSLFELEWRHVDVEAKAIRFAPIENKGGAVLEIPIDDDLLAALGEPGKPNERVLACPPDRVTVSRRFNRAVKLAGLPQGFTFHGLRRTGATELLRRGVPLHVVQKLGGWKKPDVLLKHYAQASGEDLKQAVSVLANLAQARDTSEQEAEASIDTTGA